MIIYECNESKNRCLFITFKDVYLLHLRMIIVKPLGRVNSPMIIVKPLGRVNSPMIRCYSKVSIHISTNNAYNVCNEWFIFPVFIEHECDYS